MSRPKADWTEQAPTTEEWDRAEEAIDACRRSGRRENLHTTYGDAYAYPSPRGDIIWGINGGPNGFCIAQGRANKDSK